MALRRLQDLPGFDALELRAVLKPAFAEPENRADYPEIDELSVKLFGLTGEQAEDHPRPEGWDRIERQPIPKQVLAFEDAGWDVTDKNRRPLRMLSQFNQQLWLAIRGVAGELPFAPEDTEQPDGWAAKLEAEAKRFRKR